MGTRVATIEFRNGTGVPSNSLGANGDLYLDAATGFLYKKAAGAYTHIATLAGTPGAAGSKIYNGNGAPDNTLGLDGDYYLDNATGNLYFKASGAWGVNAALTGAPGMAGTVIRNGTGVPDNSLGVNGDYYLDTTSGHFYYKSEGAYADILTLGGGGGGSTLLNGTGVPGSGTGANGNYFLATDTGIIYLKALGAWGALYTPPAPGISQVYADTHYDALGAASTAAGVSLAKTGGTMSGAIDMDGFKITDLGTPTADTDAATKAYADSLGGGGGGSGTTVITATADPATTRIFLTSLVATTWEVPDDFNPANNTIEVIGGGGGGAQGGAGGGGYSAISNAALTPGATVTIQVGSGGASHTNGSDTYLANSTSNAASITGTAVIVGAKGGASDTTDSENGGLGGQASAGVGTTKYSGGTGGGGHWSVGAGGGAAGPNGAGAAGATSDSGNHAEGAGGGADNGFGGAGGAPHANGANGTEWDATHGSGGGGGALNGGGAGTTGGLYGGGAAGGGSPGIGGQGIIVVTYSDGYADNSLLFNISNRKLWKKISGVWTNIYTAVGDTAWGEIVGDIADQTDISTFRHGNGTTALIAPTLINVVPVMTSNSAPSGTCLSFGNSGSGPAFQAFDNNSSSYWNVNTGGGGSGGNLAAVGYTFTTPTLINGCAITSRTTDESFINFTIEGSMDAFATAGVALKTVTGETWSGSERKEYVFSNSTSYTSYRVRGETSHVEIVYLVRVEFCTTAGYGHNGDQYRDDDTGIVYENGGGAWSLVYDPTAEFDAGGDAAAAAAASLPLAGGTMSDAIDMDGAKITRLGTPTADTDAATKAYADSVGGGGGGGVGNTAPTTATSPGTAGAIETDGIYLYVCTATDTWTRTLLESWIPNTGFGDGSDGAATISTDAAWETTTGVDDTGIVIRQFTNLTINSGVAVTAAHRAQYMDIFCTGSCTIAGHLSMDFNGSTATPLGDLSTLGFKVSGTPTTFTIPAAGADGGAIQNIGSGGGSPGHAGSAGSGGQAGGGGGGTGGAGGVGNIGNGGSGGAGTGYSGGSGGGGGGYNGSGVDASSAIGGGAGGDGGIQIADRYSGGGAGHPSGASFAGDSYSGAPVASTGGGGGTIRLFVQGHLTITGTISADGGAGGGGTGGGEQYGGAGAGGGSILILYAGSLTNSGSIHANGGAGGGNAGGAGGAGSVQGPTQVTI